MMKRHICMLSVVLAAFACTRETAPLAGPEEIPGGTGQEQPSDGLLYIGANLDDVATRTSLALSGETRPVLWTRDDAIGLVAADGSLTRGTLVSGAGETSAAFSYAAGSLTADPAYGFYPYSASASVDGTTATLTLPAVQTWTAESVFAPDVAVMAARIDGEELSFTNACSIVAFRLKGTAKVTRLHLRSLVSPLAGTGTVDLSAQAPVFTVSADAADASYQVTLDLGEGVQLSSSEAAAFYFVVPSGTYSDLSVMAEGSEGSWQVLSSASHTLKAGHILPFGELAEAVPASATDLSEGGRYANCYIVSPEATGTWSFDTRLVDGTAVPGVAAADILWETSAHLVRNVSFDASTGKVYFSKPSAGTGNALLAALDASGTVLQTWHIWITDYNDQTWGRNKTYETKVDGVSYKSRWHTFMDRNLGATFAPAPGKKATELYSAHSTDNFNDYSAKGKATAEAVTAAQAVEACGFLYQFGREIPFPSLNETALNAKKRTWEGEGSNPFQSYTRTLVIHPFHDAARKFELANKVETRSGMKAYPLTFNKVLKRDSGEASTSWATDAVYTGAWSTDKTNSDPCPYGYRVPAKSELYILRKHGTNYYRASDKTWPDLVTYSYNQYGTWFTSYAAHAVGGTDPLTKEYDYQFVYVPFAGFRSAGGASIDSNDYTGVVKNGEVALWCFEPEDRGAAHTYVGYDYSGTAAVVYPSDTALPSLTGDVYAPFLFAGTANIYEAFKLTSPNPLEVAQTGTAMSIRCVKIEE